MDNLGGELYASRAPPVVRPAEKASSLMTAALPLLVDVLTRLSQSWHIATEHLERRVPLLARPAVLFGAVTLRSVPRT
jgi:hypothetical protein